MDEPEFPQDLAATVRAVARSTYATDDVAIDDDARLIRVEAGAWVAAWVFVPRGEIPGWADEAAPPAGGE